MAASTQRHAAPRSDPHAGARSTTCPGGRRQGRPLRPRQGQAGPGLAPGMGMKNSGSRRGGRGGGGGSGDRVLCCRPSICLASIASTCMDESQSATTAPTRHTARTEAGPRAGRQLRRPCISSECAVSASRAGPVSVSAVEVGSRGATTRACAAGSLPRPPRALSSRDESTAGSGGASARRRKAELILYDC